MHKTLTVKEYERMCNEYDKVKYVCKWCGRKSIIPYNIEKVECSWCHHYVFKNKQDEFKYRVNEKLKKGGK